MFGGRLQVHFPGGNEAQVPGGAGKVRSHLPSTRRFPGIHFVSPGHGLDIRQSMGWTKVCGTAQSGIWVLKGNARTCMFPANLDYLQVDWMKRAYIQDCLAYAMARLCVFMQVYMEQQSDHKLIMPSGMGLRVCGAGSHPSYHLGVVRRNCQRGVNLNKYAGQGSLIRWHSDNEPLFGPQNSP